MLHPHALATTILSVLRTPWPWAAAHMSQGPDDIFVDPVTLHPAFHGCLDWHSSVHMQWSAVQLLARGDLPADIAADLHAELDARLTPSNLAVEVRYLREHPGWERPYGWGWALRLAAATDGTPWSTATSTLVEPLSELFGAWLPRLAYPVRHGVHSNTAFGLTLARDGFQALGRTDDVDVIDVHARRLFGDDVDIDVRFEPSGTDFLSPALSEADLMRRVLGADFGPWFARFAPDVTPLLSAPVVLDQHDGQLVHLFGLALSKAGQLRRLAAYVDDAGKVEAAAQALEQFALPHISDGDFMSTHWLVSFALLAQEGGLKHGPRGES